MKKSAIILSFLAVAALMNMSFTNPVNEEVLTLNLDESEIVWRGYKVTGKHHGIVSLKSGDLEMEDGKLTGGEFEIDMTSIEVKDLQGEYAGKLEGHLKSGDFFGIEKHPTAKFVITQVVSRGKPGDYKIVGNLTIKDITKEIKFQANVKEEDGKKVATANITVDRSEFNVRYGSGSFFDNLGDKTIYDEFDLEVKLVANNS